VQNAHHNAETAIEFEVLLRTIEAAPAPRLVAAALSQVRNGVITGEGPTTTGRIHFSRTIDAGDTALINRILNAGSEAVSRAEAEALFEIHEAAHERADHGRFDDLFAKAIAHHVMDAAGLPVPPRAVALDAATPLADWATPDQFVGGEVAAWLETRMRRKGRPCTPLAALAAMIGFAATFLSPSVAAAIDFAA
jgi:hypothetical protein